MSRESIPVSQALRIDNVCNRFEAAWKAGQRPRIEDFVNQVPEVERPPLFHRLLGLEIDYRRLNSDTLDPEDFRRRFPGLADLIQAVFVEEGVLGEGSAGGAENMAGPEVSDSPRGNEDGGLPSFLGRYRITAKLGEGAFGIVYKAYDDDLQRDVAIKVPHRHRLRSVKDVDKYLKEARILAGLSHPGIVPAYDMGRTPDGLCYLVSKFIEGCDLRTRMKQARFAFAEAVALVAGVAEALHYAHQRGLVHRDIKPANILLDGAGQPVVVDFGFALREADFGTGPTFAGTPAYMSPEQARGEGHRVDARTDIYSVGVVFYELLTGRRPFLGTIPEILEQIKNHEPRPARQWDDTIPKELDRICLKAMAKRAAERYATALDLADDLRHWPAEPRPRSAKPVRVQVVMPPAPAEASMTPSVNSTADSENQPINVVPRGLRSFNAHDADFFLELLPGPRDRNGLPDSLRFWKARIEEADRDNTFSVGFLYGPSGCGKSSLVKAGLLPRLAEHVIPVYVEATAEETEFRLLTQLRKLCPNLPGNLNLTETLAYLRRGQGAPAGDKVILFVDQFEQWLHAKRNEQDTELVRALRQCDGARVQAIVMVRDDFWMAATRFMRALEIRLLEGTNSAAVDLFDSRHARKVFSIFGQAFGALPQGPLEPEQEQFLEQAVTGLLHDGKIIPIRLSLFAEMVKGKPWTPATLRQVGGMEGIGVTFLEETFSSSTAPPEHRLHQRAARAVLKALLPEQGMDIKGHMRSHQELLEASGYARSPREFEALLHLLDTELRLVTPTDPEGAPAEQDAPRESGLPMGNPPDGGTPPSRPAQYYQLTHDYLVPALRQWLARKQRETRRGRAELQLAELAAQWTVKPENRHLPSWWEWIRIRLLTRPKHWTEPQRRMMRKAARYHAIWAGGVFLMVLLAAWGIYEWYASVQAAALVKRLGSAETQELPKVVAELAPYRRWANPLLLQMMDQAKSGSRDEFRARLALGVDPGQVEPLRQVLLTSGPQDFFVIRATLLPYKDRIRESLWQVVEDVKADPGARFRGGCALAMFDPENPRWDGIAPAVAGHLVTENPIYHRLWMDSLAPVRLKLLGPLAEIFGSADAAGRSAATYILAEFAADQPGFLAELILTADEGQYARLFPLLQAHRCPVLPLLKEVIQQQAPPEDQVELRDALARRQAQAALALFQLGETDVVWPLLRHGPDPSRRTYLLHALGRPGTDAGVIIRRLETEPDVSVRRALILSLGGFSSDQLSKDQRTILADELLRWYRDDPDPGLHSAVDWLLRHGRQGKAARKLDWQRANDLKQADQELAGSPPGKRNWYVDKEGHTMVVIRDPEVFLMGSPTYEPGRVPNNETPHPKWIPRSFALATKEVTAQQFQRFLDANPDVARKYETLKQYGPDDDGPATTVTWFQAALYCNWLSKQEGIPEDQWCYPPAELLGEEMKLPKDFLQRTGYRLPTEAEWEYACRAGARTSRFYGQSEDMLKEYAWYSKTTNNERVWPVGQLKPNDLGFFDVYGNVYEWCQDQAQRYRPADDGPSRDVAIRLTVAGDSPQVLRGGSFNTPAQLVRSAYRFRGPATAPFLNAGLRVARTYP